MLKTATLLAGSMLVCTLAFGQSQRIISPVPAASVNKSFTTASAESMVATCADTLNRSLLSNTLVVLELPNGLGYPAGTSIFHDKAKADKFVSTGTKFVNGAQVLIGVADTTNMSNATFALSVWSATSAGTPNVLLQSKFFPIASIMQNVADTTLANLMFDDPVKVTGTYFLGISLPTDLTSKLALYTTEEGASDPNLGWEQRSTDEWFAYSSTQAWGKNFSNAIFPIVSPLGAGFTGPSSINLNASTNDTLTFINISGGGTNFTWTFDDGAITGGNLNDTVKVLFTTTGMKEITMVRKDTISGCTDSVTKILNVYIPAGITEDLGAKVNVYPNPAYGSVTIDMAGIAAKNIIILNSIGQVVRQQTCMGSGKELVDVSTLGSGMYYLQVITSQGAFSKKISVQK